MQDVIESVLIRRGDAINAAKGKSEYTDTIFDEAIESEIVYMIRALPTVDMDELLRELEGLRIDVDAECAYQDQTGMLREKYERANEMLDDCIKIFKDHMY